eukprot:1747186-Rhodomonas_salina.3
MPLCARYGMSGTEMGRMAPPDSLQPRTLLPSPGHLTLSDCPQYLTLSDYTPNLTTLNIQYPTLPKSNTLTVQNARKTTLSCI